MLRAAVVVLCGRTAYATDCGYELIASGSLRNGAYCTGYYGQHGGSGDIVGLESCYQKCLADHECVGFYYDNNPASADNNPGYGHCGFCRAGYTVAYASNGAYDMYTLSATSQLYRSGCGDSGSASGSFVYVDQAKSFDDARAYCRANYRDLASIHSSSENAAVAALCPGTCWIGGSDAAREGTWTWSDGTAWDYENWDSGEPNNGAGDEPYTTILSWKSGRWNDAPAMVGRRPAPSTHPFVCATAAGDGGGGGKEKGGGAIVMLVGLGVFLCCCLAAVLAEQCRKRYKETVASAPAPRVELPPRCARPAAAQRPRGLRIESVAATEVNLAWEQGSAESFEVQWRKTGGAWHPRCLRVRRSKARVSELDAGGAYAFRVRPFGGDWSFEVSAQLAAAATPEPRAEPAAQAEPAPERSSGTDVCPVCLDRARDTAFVPCGHRVCAECAERISTTAWRGSGPRGDSESRCPVCRQPFSGTLRVF